MDYVRSKLTGTMGHFIICSEIPTQLRIKKNPCSWCKHDKRDKVYKVTFIA